MSKCKFSSCEKPMKVKYVGLCDGHYRQHRKGQELAVLRNPAIGCTFDGCLRPHMSHGLCEGHNAQLKRGQELRPLSKVRRRGESREEMARGVRTCVGKNGCGQTLPLSEFSKHKKTADGYTTNCKPCTRNLHMQWKYGLTQLEWDELFERQGRRCAICKTDNSRWATDHDHACCPGQKTCGKCVRAILCTPCNTTVGIVETRPDVIPSIFSYVATNPRAKD